MGFLRDKSKDTSLAAGQESMSRMDGSDSVDLSEAKLLFGTSILTTESLGGLFRAIQTSAGRNPQSDGVLTSRLRLEASVEYLDASLRLPANKSSLARVRQVAEFAVNDLKHLRRELPDPLLDGYRLSLLTSVLLASSPSHTIKEEWRDPLKRASWTLMAQALTSSGATWDRGSLWVCQVAADALDATEEPVAPHLLRRLAKAHPGDDISRRWQRRSLRKSDRALNSLSGAPAIEDLDLGRVSAEMSRLPSQSVISGGELPIVAASDPRRYREGKGLIAVRNRQLRWNRQRLLVMPVGVVAAGLVVVFGLRTRQLAYEDPLAWDLSRLNIGLTGEAALNTNLQLLATGATLTVALAVAGRFAGQERAAAVQWWSLGTAALILCAALASGVAGLLFFSTSRTSWVHDGLVATLALLIWLLVAAVDLLGPERYLEEAHKRNKVEIIDRALQQFRNQDRKAWIVTTRWQDRRQMIVYCLAAPSLLAITGEVVAAVNGRLSWTLTLQLLYLVLYMSGGAFLTAMWALDAQFRHYGGTGDEETPMRVSLTVASWFVVVMYLLASIVAGLSMSHLFGWIFVGLVFVLSVGPMAILAWGSRRPARGLKFPRRLARRHLQRRRESLASSLGRIQLG